jgi:hypothetical protein
MSISPPSSPRKPLSQKKSVAPSTERAEKLDADSKKRERSEQYRDPRLDGADDVGPGTSNLDQQEEDGRYDIGRPPPRKRRKTGEFDKDAHTVFIVDDEDSQDDSDDDSSVSSQAAAEEEHYSRGEDGAKKQLTTQERRAYWASKKVLGGNIDSSD